MVAKSFCMQLPNPPTENSGYTPVIIHCSRDVKMAESLIMARAYDTIISLFVLLNAFDSDFSRVSLFSGMERWNGMVEWNGGMEWNGME